MAGRSQKRRRKIDILLFYYFSLSQVNVLFLSFPYFYLNMFTCCFSTHRKALLILGLDQLPSSVVILINLCFGLTTNSEFEQEQHCGFKNDMVMKIVLKLHYRINNVRRVIQ